MGNELENLAMSLGNMVNGKGGASLENLVRILSTDSGKRILATLMSDGGERVKRAATGAKSGDMSGVRDIIASVAETEEGRRLLAELTKGMK